MAIEMARRGGALFRRATFALALLAWAAPCALLWALATDADSSQARLRKDVEFLADDALEGRGIDTPGIAKAAKYLADAFASIGLKPAVPPLDPKAPNATPSFLQPFRVTVNTAPKPAETRLEARGPRDAVIALKLGEDFQALALGGAGAFDAPVVFAGYGITAKEHKYDDYAGVDVAGKVVIMLRREPQQANDKSLFDGKNPSKYAPVMVKLRTAAERKAVAVLLVNDPFSARDAAADGLAAASYFGGDPANDIPMFQIRQEVVNRMLANTPLKSLAEVEAAIDGDLKPRSLELPGWRMVGQSAFEKVQANLQNVAGLLPGAGALAGQTIVIGAHYDHLGYGGQGSLAKSQTPQIHNGADDNASGTAALLELARRFAARPSQGDRRALLFVAFSAEERGLLGSRHYVKQQPLAPLDKTVAMINFDMVGRLKPDGRLEVHGVKTAQPFEGLLAPLAVKHQLQLKKVNGGSGPSDHASFHAAKVPVLHFFTGTHLDYHRPSDDVATLNFPGMARVVDMADELIAALASVPKTPEFVKVEDDDPHAGMSLGRGDGAMAYLGTVPDYGEEADGSPVSEVAPGSPAAKGGLQSGDLIIAMNDMPIKSVRGLTMALYKFKPDETVTVTVLRGKKDDQKKVELKVKLGKRE